MPINKLGREDKMLNAKPNKFSMACLTLLSLTMLTSTAFGYNDNRVSYLDSISTSYLRSNNYDTGASDYSLLNTNSYEARGVETTLRLDSSVPITKSNAIINISLRDADLKQTLRMLADKAKINIVFDESVDGKLTLDLNNVKVNDAFATIFKTSQLTYSMDDNTMTVMTLAASRDVAYKRKNVTVLPIKYVSASSVAKFLNENLFKAQIYGLSNKSIVTSNPRTNQILVFGSNEDVLAIKRMLPLLDTKPMVNSFTVNHTTPREMAQLICDSLVSNGDGSGGSGGSGGGGDEEITLGAGEIACKANDSGSSEEGLSAFDAAPLTVMFFSDLGKISVYGGSVEQVNTIRDFIKANDIKQLMAYVEMSVVELNETGMKAFNNAWNLWTPFISLGFDSSGFTVKGGGPNIHITGSGDQSVSLPGVAIWEKELQGKQATNNKALLYALQYAIENGNGRTLTNPKIMVTNGKKTTIDMTSDYVKSVTSQIIEGASQKSNVQKTYNIGNDEGLLIELVPFISPDGYVSMNITPEFATIKTTDPEGNYTLLQRRDLELKNIRIRDGETLVLAGLIKENESQKTTKMPILSDLPFIGSFFRQNSSMKSREEMVIVITPHIIKDSNASADSSVYDL